MKRKQSSGGKAFGAANLLNALKWICKRKLISYAFSPLSFYPFIENPLVSLQPAFFSGAFKNNSKGNVAITIHIMNLKSLM